MNSGSPGVQGKKDFESIKKSMQKCDIV